MNKTDQRILAEFADELPPYRRARWPRYVLAIGVGLVVLSVAVIGLDILSSLTLHVVIDR